ncbi:MAG: V-type ATP synthase subunit E [Lachnospiraceae bacterium]|jgi:V/A-type H+-transporting ATPase subunit E|nr:V-type ATP synthase subunit E [Lachnospiraceae bacterium]MCI1727064.1 V-type ATP synthase subunit E [Lachnospiraceae bacterium]
MAGIDKITGEILQEAQDKAKEILAQAEEAAGSVRSAAEKEASQMKALAAEQSDREVRNYAARIKSSIDIQRKKEMLAARQEIINDVIDKAYRKLDQQDDASYFEMIRKLLSKSVSPEEGTILFSEKDLKRMPQGFEAEIAKIASEKGGSLKLSETPGRIDNGFVLSYGGIEENCSLKAIFDSKKDEIQDKAYHILFA